MSDVRRAAYFLNLLFAIMVALALWSRHAAAPPPPLAVFVPQRIGDWLSQGDRPLPDGAREALASARVLQRAYRRSGFDEDTPEIEITMIAGNDRSELHDPRSCLVGAGWDIENDHVESLPRVGIPVRVCRLTRRASNATAKTTYEAYDALYFYVVDGKVVSHATRIRTEMLWSALIGRTNRTVYFFRFVKPAPIEDVPDAASSDDLTQFGADLWPSIASQVLTKA